MKPIYGPVPSWRLGVSLGIDPICEVKVCSFDCVYCQLGRTTKKITKRHVFVDTKIIEQELRQLSVVPNSYDVATLSGTGEPELAQNLRKIIEATKNITKLPVAVLTNSFLMHEKSVRNDLSRADIIVAKLDAPNRTLFKRINNPHPDIDFESMLEGMIKFRGEFDGKYALQMMFIDKNKKYAKKMRTIAEEIQPDEIQLNTPSRSCNIRCLSSKEMNKITKVFNGMNYISYYERKKPKVKSIDRLETSIRRPLR